MKKKVQKAKVQPSGASSKTISDVVSNADGGIVTSDCTNAQESSDVEDLSTDDKPLIFRYVSELPEEEKNVFFRELALYEFRARDEDRHRVQDECSRNFQQICKIFISLASCSLGGGALSTLCLNVTNMWLLISCLLFVLSIGLMLFELLNAMVKQNRYANQLALNDGQNVQPPSDIANYWLLYIASFLLFLGLVFYVVSVYLHN